MLQHQTCVSSKRIRIQARKAWDFLAAPALITLIALERTGQKSNGICSVEKKGSKRERERERENKAPTSLNCFPDQQHAPRRPTPSRKKTSFFTARTRLRTGESLYQTAQGIRARSIRGVRQIWRRGRGQGNGRQGGPKQKKNSTFPAVDELICRRRGRPAHGAAGHRRGNGVGGPPRPAAQGCVVPCRVVSGSGGLGGGRAAAAARRDGDGKERRMKGREAGRRADGGGVGGWVGERRRP
jgi:hypothetical protein